MNVSKAMREGWEPVRAEDVPELQLQPDRNSRYPGMMEVGGLLLCKASRPVMDQRDAYYRKQAAAQLRAVEDDLMRESNPVMPIHRPERRSSVSFGHGRASDD